jgi:hypothetical protein
MPPTASLPPNQPVVTTGPARDGSAYNLSAGLATYTGADIPQLYRDVGAAENPRSFSSSQRYVARLAPGVESYVIFGSKNATPR